MATIPSEPIPTLAIGKVIEVDGTHIVCELDPGVEELTRLFRGSVYPIGQFGSVVRIHFARRVLYAYVSRLRMKAEYERERGLEPGPASDGNRVIEADLFGEGEWRRGAGSGEDWTFNFDRGVTTFPLPQQVVYLTPREELSHIFAIGEGPGIHIGDVAGAAGIPCLADLDELVGKHTAILGATGAGKSGAVAAVVHAMLERGELQKYENWNPRIVILDPHAEYSAAFKGCAVLDPGEGGIQLPYWLLSLEETVDLIVGKTEYVATRQSNVIKQALLSARNDGAAKLGIPKEHITVDSPIPYTLGNPRGVGEFGEVTQAGNDEGFVGYVNKQRPPGKNRKEHDEFNTVLRKLEIMSDDARYRFLMTPWDGVEDGIQAVVQQFVGEGHPVRVVDLSGVPSEIAGYVSSSIARVLFMMRVWQTHEERKQNPVLLVCEEAHRYVPERGEAQYETARTEIQRIAKEGRKYGLGLFLVSQRPSDVDATVLSQCNSWLVLRITNEADRQHVRSVLPDSMAGMTKSLSGLRRREAIFVGQATLLPVRVLLRELREDQLPDSRDISFDKGWQAAAPGNDFVTEVASRWRLQRMDAKTVLDEHESGEPTPEQQV